MVMMRMNWKKGGLEPVKYPELKRGQVIHSWSGTGGYCHTKSVLVSISKDNWGTHYHAINMETYDYRRPDAPRPIEEKNSLGSYFKQGEILPEKEVVRYEKLALEKKKRDEVQKELERIATEKRQDAGRVLFEAAIKKHGKPKALIIAELREDQSDLMQDYWGAITVRRMVLAFSKHTRNNFKEFRKAALNSDIPGVKELATAPADWEHRENYSMGGGYYLGHYRHGGWQISKNILYRDQNLEYYYETAGEDGAFCIK